MWFWEFVYLPLFSRMKNLLILEINFIRINLRHLVLLLLLLSRFSCVRLCVTPEKAAYQAPLSLGFSRREHWSGLPFPSPMHESGKWKWSCSVVSDPQWPHGLQPSRLLHPWDFPGKSTGVGCHCLLQCLVQCLAKARPQWLSGAIFYTVHTRSFCIMVIYKHLVPN